MKVTLTTAWLWRSVAIALMGLAVATQVQAAGELYATEQAEKDRLERENPELKLIVRVAPRYPRKALSAGIEGYVVAEFTVTASGSVENAKVIESVPARVFDQEALQAVSKFKYKPRTVNGEAVSVEGVRNKIEFSIAF